ncbi:DUF2806 domain-containing protein [Desulfovibrio subterraneus]|nr:DUF2806 domain-containing protein [Desulfovibrio subterraneus]
MGFDVKAEVKLDATKSAELAAEGCVKGSNKLFELCFGKRMADNIRYAALTAAQTERDLQSVLSGEAEFRDGNIVPVTLPSVGNLLLDAERQQELENLHANLKIAYHELESVPDDEISDREVGSDFFARWRREAKVIGESDLQFIWGKVLAEEIRSPDSISYRTLDVIKNLTKREAEVFHKASGYIFNKHGVVMVEGKTSVTYNDIVVLSECGLVVPGVNGTMATFSDAIFYEGKKGCFTRFEGCVFVLLGEQRISIACSLLTEAGKQLYNIIDRKMMRKEDFVFVAGAMKVQRGDKISVRVLPLVDENRVDVSNLYFAGEV